MSAATSEFGTFRKCSNVRLESGMRTKADVANRSEFVGSRPNTLAQKTRRQCLSLGSEVVISAWFRVTLVWPAHGAVIAGIVGVPFMIRDGHYWAALIFGLMTAVLASCLVAWWRNSN